MQLCFAPLKNWCVYHCLVIGLLLSLAPFGLAQDEHDHSARSSDSQRSTVHQEGLHVNSPTGMAIVNATVHRRPGLDAKVETVIVDGSRIVAIGSGLKIPDGVRTIDATGKHLYAGFTDGYTGLEIAKTDSKAHHEHDEDAGKGVGKKGTAYWNDKVTPELKVADEFGPHGLERKEFREAGFTSALVAPTAGVIQGQSSLLLMGSQPTENSFLNSNVAMHLRLTVSRGSRGGGYPNSPMGAYALARQALYDAQWYQQAWQTARADTSVERPETNVALEELQPTLSGGQMVMIDTSNELFAVRADRFVKEFGLQLVILGSGNEYRRLNEIARLGRTIVVPVNFGKAPDVSSPELANDVTLEALMHWDHAPENPKRLHESDVNFVFTTKGLKDKTDFLKNVRTAVKRGLPAEAALAAMTIGPAQLYGVEDLVGSLEKGKIANLVVTDGELFDDDTEIIETWVDGVRFELEEEPLRDVEGIWSLKGRGFSGKELVLKKRKDKLAGRIVDKSSAGKRNENKWSKNDAETSDSDNGDEKKKPADVAINPIALSGTRLTGAFRSDKFGHDGISLFSLLVGTDDTATGKLVLANGKSIPFSAKRLSQESQPEPDGKTNDKDVDNKIASDETLRKNGKGKDKEMAASYAVNYPLGAYGRQQLPDQPGTVLITNVTVWSLDENGKFEKGAVLFGNGWIQSVFKDGENLPSADIEIDGEGAHLTPGIIDCHSHMATDSGVNESGQAITAEVRIGDMIDCDDITIYRQLAGGVTTANILHGSANPIGGQNQVIKLRWGTSERAMKFTAAPQGIKFALGENVKQSNWDNPTDRYPQTRMGVEQIMDDALRAAKDYREQRNDWDKNRKGLPPRRDLELDAIVEILDGTRWIHCHSYRQDEILALMRTLESHKITIGTFQHILEGYKVADQMAEHGAMASAFADWWAYKYEVKDAIPYAGALMHRAGVVVSFNSDDAELGRHLNHEAAKAVRYGGVSEVEALKFVTLNPARQLRIDDRVGSIEVGKDADLVLWSGHPLSNMSVVKQTWVDGRKYFDREEDNVMRTEIRQQRLALIQKILASGEEMEATNSSSIDPAKLWPRHDEFCHGHSHDGHDHDSHETGGGHGN